MEGRTTRSRTSIDTALGLVAVALLIAVNAIFVAAEFALVAVDRDAVHDDASSGQRRARTLEGLLRRLSFHLSGAQLGITVTSLVLGFLAEPVLGHLLEPVFEPLVGEVASTGVAIVAALVLATVVQMVVGELIPKGVAIARPDRTARALAPLVRAYGAVFGPVIGVLDGAANRTVRALGIEPAEELSHVRSLAEFELLANAAVEQGTLAGSASALLSRSIRFGQKTVADALVPRPDVKALSSDASVSDLVDLAASTGHSRFPVFGADLDDVRGMVHVRSVHEVPHAERAERGVSTLMSDVLVVPESRHLDDVLLDMRTSRQHLAVVIDEYGGTAGIVTLEDVLEEIVGEIDDEYDSGRAQLTQAIGSGVFVISGGLHPDEVGEIAGFEVPEGDYDTIAGFVLDRLGRIPDVGDQLTHDGWTIEVTGMDRRRISEVELRAPRPDGSAMESSE